MFSLPGLLWSILVCGLQNLFPESIGFFVNWGTLFLILALMFYLRLSFVMFLGMLLIATLMVAGIYLLQNKVALPLWISSLIVFAGAWIGQFSGHRIEGKSWLFGRIYSFCLSDQPGC
jgi:uncharacterized membrane protein YGL010W